MTFARRYRDRASWLAARRIGSSDVATILGVGPTDEDEPRHSEWDVLMRLRGELRNRRATRDQERGIRLEPRVLRRYARATGRTVRPTPPHTLWTRDDWASATPDARDELGVIEAKTDRHRWRWGPPDTITRWERDASQIVRPDYYLQVAHQLFVLDAQVGHLAVLLPPEDPFEPLELRTYRIHRDRELEEALVDRLSTWWARHVIAGEPPELDGSRAAGLWLTQTPELGERDATPAEVALAAAYETARVAAQQWEEARRLYGQRLVLEAGGARRLVMPRGRVTVVRQPGRSHLDERSLLEARPDLAPVLDEHRRTSEPSIYPRISGLESK